MNFKNFNELEFEDFNSDYHIHSTWTDGKPSISEIFEHCDINNIKNFGLSDHIRSTSTYYKNYIKEINFHRSKYKNLKAFIGFESKILEENKIDIPPELINLSDYIISSVHSIIINGKVYNPRRLSYLECMNFEFQVLLSYKEKIHKNNFIGHIFGMTLKYHKKIDLNKFEDICKIMKEREIPIEISFKYHSLFLNEIIDILKKINPIIIINSDAHELNEITYVKKNNLIESILIEN